MYILIFYYLNIIATNSLSDNNVIYINLEIFTTAILSRDSLNFNIKIDFILTIHEFFIFILNNSVIAVVENKVINVTFMSSAIAFIKDKLIKIIIVIIIIENKIINVAFNISAFATIAIKTLNVKLSHLLNVYLISLSQ